VLQHVAKLGGQDLLLACLELEIVEPGNGRAPLMVKLVKDLLHKCFELFFTVDLLHIDFNLLCLDVHLELGMSLRIVPKVKLLRHVDRLPKPVSEVATCQEWSVVFDYSHPDIVLCFGRLPFFVPH
jgi:hypothetical protein